MCSISSAVWLRARAAYIYSLFIRRNVKTCVLCSEDVLLSDPSEDGDDGNRTEDVRPAAVSCAFAARCVSVYLQNRQAMYSGAGQ